jgi:methionyl aminopeptidase
MTSSSTDTNGGEATTTTTCTLKCSSPSCDKPVSSNLACPKCLQLGLPAAYFCTQECFKSNYNTHKQVHNLAKQIIAAQSVAMVPQHRKTPPRDGVSCSHDAPADVKLSLPDWAAAFHFTGTLRPALYGPKRIVPASIRKPDYATHIAGVSESERRDKANHSNIRVYTADELDGKDANDNECGLRHACQMGREVLDECGKALRVGVTADEIDRVAHEASIERNCYPSPLNYYNFPKSVCVSVNEVICHGIPDFREVQNGDIVNIDVTTFNAGGYHGDLNETYSVGTVDADGQRLVRTAFECLASALALVKPGCLYRDLGTAIHKVATANQCSVVRTYCGHGIGSLFHTIPNIPHYHKNKAKGIMKVGHVFTVEPMINLGTPGDTTWYDNWTAVTTDGKRSAQFEHTVVVTETGCEILTARANEPVMTWNPELNTR